RNTLSAARYFHDFGFTKSKFLPAWNYEGNHDTTKVYGAYTHYPALPDVLAGIYACIFNGNNETVIRIIPVLISLLFFYFIFYSLRILLPDQKAAFISACILVTSNYFVFWADNLHKHQYEELLKWVYLFCLFRYYESGRKNKRMLILLATVYLVEINISFEPVAYLAILTLGFSWIYRRSVVNADNILLLAIPVAGFGIHLLQNYFYLGSWPAVKYDMVEALKNRTTGVDSELNELGRHVGLIDYARIPFITLNRIERFFLLPGYAFLLFAILG